VERIFTGTRYCRYGTAHKVHDGINSVYALAYGIFLILRDSVATWSLMVLYSNALKDGQKRR
jgi:hypothetical protein